ncbi:NAD(P)/FAD-dependent oxidoreductase [Metallosphaera hakonensis]|uniref:Pyridine nucleotide-disulfide oxidoreductase n=1 Tax=Metallosphaera hakonensis JCM 8857 = DSM 7519 TaxID=1293036 RepID=A0A2U9ISH4_9CREN|nr:FAD/NAD(P)-binding oxidoreductase [Metallosphaera hakonensis]AWR98965.1 NAD(P)/FAD-dependent oxidoreductase [Metallosphaera hakonensis JCM 8857 = DSM 7519]
MDRVIIVGGGNGGTVVANRLSGKGLDVTVIEPLDYHLYQPGMVDYVLGEETEESIVRTLDSLLPVKRMKGRVTKVDVENHSVFMGDERVEYDYLVLAPGVISKRLEGSYGWHTLEEGKKLREDVSNFSGKSIVVGYSGVIKCPAAPFEFSFLLKEKFPKAQVTLLNPVTNPPEIQRPMAEAFGKKSKELGIEVKRGFKIARIDQASKVIESDSGEKVSYDLALIDPPVKVGEEFKDLTDQSGFIPVDRSTLRYRNYDNVYVIGDANNILTPPKTGSKAHYEAKIVADNIIASVKGGERKNYDGSAICAVYASSKKGYLIRMNFEKSNIYGASPLFYEMKKMFTHMYWASLRGFFP